MKYITNIGDDTVRHLRDALRHICRTFPRRAPGSNGERDAADYFAGLLTEYADEVHTQAVAFRPAAHFHTLPVSAVLMSASSVIFLFRNSVSSYAFAFAPVVFSLLAAAIYFYGFVFGKKTLDFLFPRSESKNVYATRHSLKKAENRVIFCTSLDTPPQWRFSAAVGGAPVWIFIAVYTCCLVLSMLLFLTYLITGASALTPEWITLGKLQLFSNIVFIPAVFFFSRKSTNGGSAHNAAGCCTAVGILRELEEGSFHYDTTEVACLLTCAGSAGNRGASAFIAEHKEELKKLNTTVIVLDSLCKPANLCAVATDECGLSRPPRALYKSVSDAISAVTPEGTAPKSSSRIGSTEAMPFIRAGVNAVTIRAVDKNSPYFYPNKFDNEKTADPDCMAKTVQAAIEILNGQR